jgi:hypothetical protein
MLFLLLVAFTTALYTVSSLHPEGPGVVAGGVSASRVGAASYSRYMALSAVCQFLTFVAV